MPSMANITVKADNGTTDVVYTALTPSAGDSVAAQWRVDAASTKPAFRPSVEMRSQYNGPRSARRVNVRAKYPVVETVNGADTLVGTIPVEFTMTLPLGVADTATAEAVSQFGNLLVSSLIRSSIKAGFSPT